MLRCQLLTNPEWKRDLQTALKNLGVERRVRALMSYGIRTWVEGEVTNMEDYTEAEKNVFSDQGQIGWSHLLKGRISADWAAVINAERIENGEQAHPRANVKVIREIIPIVLDLWMRLCEVAFGKKKGAKDQKQKGKKPIWRTTRKRRRTSSLIKGKLDGVTF